MISRTTDDYMKMAMAGCKAITEPAFWAGFDRSNSSGFYDYFRQLTEFENKRAKKYGIEHYCWVCINPKESEDHSLASEVIKILPDFLKKPSVLGIGEIGLNKNTKKEIKMLEAQLELAATHDQLVLVHTPHLEDKLKGTKLIIDIIKNESSLKPEKILIDHIEEHTVELVLQNGFWGGMTIYPDSKCTPDRAVDILETWGLEKLCVNSAGDWGHSDPLAVPKWRFAMEKRGHSTKAIQRICWDNPYEFLNQSKNFNIKNES